MPATADYADPKELAKVAGLALRARRVVEGPVSGQHRSPFHGFSVEFAEHREYSPGDDLRRMDWRVYARSDRYYTKRFEEETNLRATLVVDASRSMQYGRGPLRKFDYACTLAACLAHLLVKQRDRVGLALVDTGRREVLPPASTQAQLVRIAETLEAARPDRATELGDGLCELAEQVRQRGLLIVVSDLLTDLDRWRDGLARLQFRRHDLMMLHVLDRDELELPFRDMTRFRDLEGDEEIHADPNSFRKAYREAMAAFVAEVRGDCAARGIAYELFTTDGNLGDALSRFLHAREQRR